MLITNLGRRPRKFSDFFLRFSLFSLVLGVFLGGKIIVWRPCGAHGTAPSLFTTTSYDSKTLFFRFTGGITRLYHCRMFGKYFFEFQNVGWVLKRSKMRSFRVSPPQAPKKLGYFGHLRNQVIKKPPPC